MLDDAFKRSFREALGASPPDRDDAVVALRSLFATLLSDDANLADARSAARQFREVFGVDEALPLEATPPADASIDELENAFSSEQMNLRKDTSNDRVERLIEIAERIRQKKDDAPAANRGTPSSGPRPPQTSPPNSPDKKKYLWIALAVAVGLGTILIWRWTR